MKIAVTGHKGNIGSRLVKKGYIPLDCDVTNVEQVFDTVSDVNPDVIVHCAAKTDVGWCEKNEKKAYAINVLGTSIVLESFAGRFIYLSTVHVFNGKKYFPYSEKHEPNVVNAYGATKLAGEMVTRLWDNPYTILRISKSFDVESMIDTIDYLDGTNDTVEFTSLIKRSFVHIDHLVEGIMYVAENDLGGVELLHVAGKDMLSYYDFWVQAAHIFGFDAKRIIARKHEIDDYPRPFRGGLAVKKAEKLGVPLYSAIDGLKMIKETL